MMRKIMVALAGNPNSGKTSIFNNLTGARQHVGNYPGVTVEKKEGICRHHDFEINVVDLPGTYSLTAYSIEEVVARNFIIDEKPDVVVDIVDASNLERNLYLAVQLIELGAPLVLAFNMSDVAKARGMEFDLGRLSELLGAPIVPTVGHKGIGMKELLDAIVSVAKGENRDRQVRIAYGREIEVELSRIQQLLREEGALSEKYGTRWLALKLLENDKDVRGKIGSSEIVSAVEQSAARIEKMFGDHPEIIIADRRYGFISGACQEAVRSTVEARHTMSDRIDAVVTNRVLGLPIFLGLMYLVFHLTFTLGEAPMGWIESFFGWLGKVVSGWWPEGSQSALRSLLVDGIIGGVGGVLVFLPNILLLFLAIAILEDSGYMARAAFIMDRLMHKIGLHGKSFISLLLGFGCTIPAIMSTRTLENRRDRLVTMLVAPLMSCGARLPIYALIIPAFFPRKLHAPMLWGIYLIGIALAVLSAKLLRSVLFKGENAPFVMELPPYRMPTLRSVLIHMWERCWLYLKKAGTIILGVSVLLWAMTSYPKKGDFGRDYEFEVVRLKAEYVARAAELNAVLGLAHGSKALVNFVEADLESGDRGPGRGAGEQQSNGGPSAIAKFMEVLELVERARAVFKDAVEEGELEDGSPGYVALERERDAALARAREIDPQAYEAVIKYLDEVKVPFVQKRSEIERARQAEGLAYSIAGRIGHVLEPVLRPMGFDWRIGTALIGAFAAKEVFVAQMGIVYSVGEADEGSEALRSRLRRNYSPLVAFCIMLFCLVSSPCVATVAVTKQESGSWKWAFLQFGGLTVLAYVLTAMVYQVGRIVGLG